MSDRVSGFVVVLDGDYKDEDAEHIQETLMMLKCVAAVRPVVATPADLINRERVRIEFREKLFNVFRENNDG